MLTPMGFEVAGWFSWGDVVGVEARKDAVFLTDGAEEGVELANRPPPPDLNPPLEPPPPLPRSDGRGEGVRAGLVRELLES